jgi:hypothetical protein
MGLRLRPIGSVIRLWTPPPNPLPPHPATRSTAGRNCHWGWRSGLHPGHHHGVDRAVRGVRATGHEGWRRSARWRAGTASRPVASAVPSIQLPMRRPIGETEQAGAMAAHDAAESMGTVRFAAAYRRNGRPARYRAPRNWPVNNRVAGAEHRLDHRGHERSRLVRLAEIGGVAEEHALWRGGGDAAGPRGAGRVHAPCAPHVLLRGSA